MTSAVSLAQGGTNNVTMRNRIINGAMMIDQRNAGASVTPTTYQYTLDRWVADPSASSKFSVQQNAGSVTPPTGFTSYLGATSLSAYSPGTNDYFGIGQAIEGYNIADLAWGTANAKAITISFWVRSSLTGTFGAAIRNSGASYNYPFTYTISSANTWEQKTVTIAGPTSGTWVVNNGQGLYLLFSLGIGTTYAGTAGAWTSSNVLGVTGQTNVVATNSATWQVTGVQLEAGTTATPFEYRLYGTELALCQRYAWQVATGENQFQSVGMGLGEGASTAYIPVQYPVPMRNGPALTYSALSDFLVDDGVGGAAPTGLANSRSTTVSCVIQATGISTAAGRAANLRANQTTARLLLSAEL
jgi:hypothetical protein